MEGYGATGPACALQIVAGAEWEIVVDDPFQFWYVESACAEIGAEHEFALSIAEELVILQACLFVQCAVQGDGFDSALFEEVLQFVEAVDGVAEDDGFDVSALLEQLEEGFVFVKGGAVDEFVADVLQVEVGVLVHDLQDVA
jgi:hypothetical protein